MKQRNLVLKERVLKCRDALKNDNIKSARFYFKEQFKTYTDKERLNNLWYCRVFDEQFTRDLEKFTKQKTKK